MHSMAHRPVGRRDVIARDDRQQAGLRAAGGAQNLVEIAAAAVLAGRDDHARLRVAQDAAALRRRQPRVHRHRDRAQRVERQERRHPRERVLQPESDAVAGLHVTRQRLRRGVHPPLELGVRQRDAVDPQRRLVGVVQRVVP
jgi:hypothetical protein